MLKKIILGILLITVLGAGGAAYVYQASSPETEPPSSLSDPLAEQTENEGAAQQNPGQGNDGEQTAAGNGQGTPIAQGAEGEPWEATGTILALDDFGFDMTLDTGETVYIELGPPDYWQAQGVELAPGQTVRVQASFNEGMIHAVQVQLADGQTLQVRSETGQPLWSGGADHEQGQGAAQADGTHTPNPQAQVDEWITITGAIIAYQGNWMTVAADDGQIVTFQTGQPRFFASQGVTFQVGDDVVVVGFYAGDQFTAGDITQAATGMRVILRDPNGRPLWAGPGNGNGNGGGG